MTTGAFLHSPLLDELKAIHVMHDEVRQHMANLPTLLQDGSNKSLPITVPGNSQTNAQQQPHATGDVQGVLRMTRPEAHSQNDGTSLRVAQRQAFAAYSETPNSLLNSSDLDLEVGADCKPQLRVVPPPQQILVGRTQPLSLAAPSNPEHHIAAMPCPRAREQGQPASTPGRTAERCETRNAGMSAGAGAVPIFNEDDLKCPICLEIMYLPIGKQSATPLID
jgi:hypothetical protein